MAEETTKVGSQKPENKAEEFIKKYQALCEEMGYQLVTTPVWKATSHGSFELVLQFSVGELPK